MLLLLVALVILFSLLPSPAVGQERFWLPRERRKEANEQKIPEGMRVIQALGRKDGWLAGVVGEDMLREDVGLGG